MTTALSKIIQNNENLETYCLIWLDSSVNSFKENQQAQQQLQTIINHILTFEDDHQCLQYIQSLSKDDRIILIISGKFGRQILPQIGNLRQISSIYVYCFDKKANEQWSQHFTKVKGVINRLDELIQRIEEDYIQQQHNKLDESLVFKIFDSNIPNEEQSFIQSQLLIDCLIRLKPSFNDKTEFLSFCKQYYKNNNAQLMIVKEFKDNYSSDRSIWWYTRQSFLYRLLNKAFRTQNIDLLFLLRFFIHDLAFELAKHRCSSLVQVYRSQLMTRDEIEILKNSMGEFISINSFFSTSLNREHTRSLLSSTDFSNDIEKVFFEIDADPRLKNIKPFSNITSQSYYPKEKEVLFMVGSIFRLVQIKCDNDRIWNIRLVLCSADDDQLQSFVQYTKNELGIGKTDLLRFGHVVYQIDKLNNAEKYYRRFLNQLPDGHPDIPNCYHALGMIAESRKDFQLSLKWYNKSLKILMQTQESNDPKIADIYNNIADVYYKIGDYANAIEWYQKALEIWKEASDEKHPRVAKCLTNLGVIYEKKKKYSEALKYYQKALSISEKILPSKHPDMAMIHRNIGNIYELKCEFQQALSSYEKAIKIYRHLLPSTQISVNEIEKIIRRISSKLE